MNKSDVIVLGGGPGGYLAAQRAAEGGKTVTLIEDRHLGGVCLNEGCIPSKTLLNSAKIYDYAKDSSHYGITTNEARLDHQKVIERKNAVVKTLVKGVTTKLKGNGVNVVFGTGALKSKTQKGIEVCVGDESYVGEKVIIATGSNPIIPNIPGIAKGVESGFVITNREIFNLIHIPSNLVIIGGGVVGVEMASYFASAGTNVTVIEMMDTIAPAFDRDITDALLVELKKKGIKFLLSSQVTDIREGVVCYKASEATKGNISEGNNEDNIDNKDNKSDKDNKGTITWEDNIQKQIKADYVLCSIGRAPTITNVGLENLNIYINNGAIVADDNMQTSVSGVYAVGDVNGKYMLAHTAYREAEVAVNHILGKKETMSYNAVPSVIYTYPEVACVGMTEKQAKDAGLKVKSITKSFMYSGRYLAEVDKGNGFCKIIVDTKRDCIVGVHMIGSYVSEMVYGVTHMIEAQTPINQIKETIFPHPTVCEVIREALFEM